MSNIEISVAINAHVYLDPEEAHEISTGATWINAPTQNTKVIIRYAYEGEGRGWVFVGGTIYFKRIKKDGSLYKDEQSLPLWRHTVSDEIVRKYRPSSTPTVRWNA